MQSEIFVAIVVVVGRYNVQLMKTRMHGVDFFLFFLFFKKKMKLEKKFTTGYKNIEMLQS